MKAIIKASAPSISSSNIKLAIDDFSADKMDSLGSLKSNSGVRVGSKSFLAKTPIPPTLDSLISKMSEFQYPWFDLIQETTLLAFSKVVLDMIS